VFQHDNTPSLVAQCHRHRATQNSGSDNDYIGFVVEQPTLLVLLVHVHAVDQVERFQ
jgi:hypothetical protein